MSLKKAKNTLVEDDSNDWLLSYADMVTLLFTFFVVLFSISNPDMVKLQLLSNYFSEEKTMSYAELQQKITEFVETNNVSEQVEVSLTSKGVEISFKDKLLYESGSADLKPAASPILGKIAELLMYQEISNRKILVEGHTDCIPIKSDQFPSNWELSGARAASVVRFFASRGLTNERFQATGYADTRPLEEKDRLRGKSVNRRVVVVISPESYLNTAERRKVSSTDTRASAKVRKAAEAAKKYPRPQAGKTQAVPPSSAKAAAPASLKARKGAFFTKGQALFKSGDYSAAIEQWKKVLEIDPGHDLSRKNIARAKLRLSESK
jgi:chemotaxis protein MotB